MIPCICLIPEFEHRKRELCVLPTHSDAFCHHANICGNVFEKCGIATTFQISCYSLNELSLPRERSITKVKIDHGVSTDLTSTQEFLCRFSLQHLFILGSHCHCYCCQFSLLHYLCKKFSASTMFLQRM